ncbi:hypothetical protein CTA2_2503 [Colletotrichum tanaceti]|uniref:Small secreted protein n=1 Tax=Colletotrichum tanaceti TaxID=1306861 RepID=A0A4V6DHK3_9PEZI|nr:hypothetical protein CTA2_2503 [Colletotrichum tanaceti]TKW56166.1 hypothetical protein CTA1_2967 [Colletotrichum tanaceti]
MHISFVLNTLVALGAATAVSASAIAPRANRKANEFSSGNCAQGTASYEHESNFNVDVTMDDTSHSVYFASGPWFYYGGKTGNGGSCTGDLLGSWANDEKNPCVNLDRRGDDGRRIKCVRWNNSS